MQFGGLYITVVNKSPRFIFTNSSIDVDTHTYMHTHFYKYTFLNIIDHYNYKTT